MKLENKIFLNASLLFLIAAMFATNLNVQSVNALLKWRGGSEPYFYFDGTGEDDTPTIKNFKILVGSEEIKSAIPEGGLTEIPDKLWIGLDVSFPDITNAQMGLPGDTKEASYQVVSNAYLKNASGDSCTLFTAINRFMVAKSDYQAHDLSAPTGEEYYAIRSKTSGQIKNGIKTIDGWESQVMSPTMRSNKKACDTVKAGGKDDLYISTNFIFNMFGTVDKGDYDDTVLLASAGMEARDFSLINAGQTFGTKINSPNIEFQIQTVGGSWLDLNSGDLPDNQYTKSLRVKFEHDPEVFAAHQLAYLNAITNTCTGNKVPADLSYCIVDDFGAADLSNGGLKHSSPFSNYDFIEDAQSTSRASLTFRLGSELKDTEKNNEPTKRNLVLYDNDKDGLPDKVDIKDSQHGAGEDPPIGVKSSVCNNPTLSGLITGANDFEDVLCKVVDAVANFFIGIMRISIENILAPAIISS